VNVSTIVFVVLAPIPTDTPAGRPVAERFTLPVNPFTSVTVIVTVPVPPWAIEIAGGFAVSVKLGGGGAVTVSAMVVDAVKEPEVPVTVTVLVPTVAVADAVNVNMVLLPVVEAGTKAAVTPAGREPVVKATVPVKPPAGVIAIVLLTLAPWCTV
jgi:hypothetical protein